MVDSGGRRLTHDAQLPLKTQESVTLFRKSRLQCADRTTVVVRAVAAQLTLYVTAWILGRAKAIQEVQG